MAKDEKDTVQSDTQQGGAMSEAEIDRTLKESFPASDPPSWTLGTNHRQESDSEEEKSTDSSEEE